MYVAGAGLYLCGLGVYCVSFVAGCDDLVVE